MPGSSLIGALSFLAIILWEIVKFWLDFIWELIYDIPPEIKVTVFVLVIGGTIAKHIGKKLLARTNKKRLAQELKEAFLNDITLQTATEETNCRVCGEAFGEIPIIACRLCGTIHHEDCWNYSGQCSVYGCGATRSMKEVPE